MDFDEVRISDRVSYGARGGPERRVDIVELESGFEERNTPWAHSRRSYDISYGIRNIEDAYGIIEFFEARYGNLYGFRFKDWADYKSTNLTSAVTAIDQNLGTGDGVTTTFQLTKTYVSGPRSYTRDISKPVAGTVLIAVDGAPTVTGWAVDSSTGVVAFDVAPALGAVLRAGFEFDVPVRFNTTGNLPISLDNFEKAQVSAIPLIEVRV